MKEALLDVNILADFQFLKTKPNKYGPWCDSWHLEIFKGKENVSLGINYEFVISQCISLLRGEKKTYIYIYIYIYMVERRNKQKIDRYEPADI